MKENLAYLRHFKRLRKANRGYSDVVGGDYENMGYLLRCLMQWAGLRPEHSVVDVGCGTGRLAYQLSKWGLRNYHGYDIVDGLIEDAAKRVRNKSYRYGIIENEHIPLPDNSRDFVCFFSVFTHIPHHLSYRYLMDALRVLKPGGRVVFSYLAYDCPEHWSHFAAMIANRGQEPINQLMTHDQVRWWSERLNANMVKQEEGLEPYFPIEHPVTLDNGAEMIDKGAVGQSVCVLEKPENWAPNHGF